ncbi:MAG: ATP-dependent DNA helicase DinG, partial [Burkholderiaceae bacterium]
MTPLSIDDTLEQPEDALVAQAMAAFDTAVSEEAGFRSRPGQRQMAERVAQTFSSPDLGARRQALGDTDDNLSAGARPVGQDEVPPRRAFAVIQAGTGVGKSLAYSAPAVALALARNTRVLIATATVALQEQLVNKDLPALAASLPQPFRFALAKGRGRYVCRLKLERLLGPDGQEADDLFADLPPPEADRPGAGGFDARRAEWQTMAQALATDTWDGDRDSLPVQPDADIWQPVAAEAASCTAKHCPLFSRCPYFERRKDLVGAQVIVANHDLLLSSLGSRVLPELDHCLLVLDEAHHLPAVALDQFTRSMDLTRLRWVDQLAQRALQVGAALYLSDAVDSPRLAATLRLALQEVARFAMDE